MPQAFSKLLSEIQDQLAFHNLKQGWVVVQFQYRGQESNQRTAHEKQDNMYGLNSRLISLCQYFTISDLMLHDNYQ